MKNNNQNIDSNIVAGVLIKCRKTSRFLLVLRNENFDGALTWSIPCGHIKFGESILEGLKRELNEELKIDPNIIDFDFVRKENNNFYYFWGYVDNEFKCSLDAENLNYIWAGIKELPTPLYVGLYNRILEFLN